MAKSVEMAKAFLERIAQDNRAFYGSSRGQGALRDLQQTFPHQWIYVAELLQNAVDEGARSIQFSEPTPGVLVLEHDGKTFDERDVEGVCTKGVSSKGAGTVGFMGVGFKAVFRSFETVTISSGPWRFRLRVRVVKGSQFGDLQRDWMGAVLPEWDDAIPAPSNGMTCRFELRDRVANTKSIDADFKQVFRGDNALMALLATREVTEVRLFGTIWLLSVEEQEQEEDLTRCHICAVDDRTESMSQWMLFRVEYEPSHEAVRRFLEHRAINPAPENREQVYAEAARKRRVEIFFPLDQEGFPDLPEHGEAFALLPTMQKLPFGVHVNADWLLTVTRMEFMDVEQGGELEGNEWQKEIRGVIPQLITSYFDWLVSDDGPDSGDWKSAYGIFPELTVQGRFDSWLLGGEFKSKLKEMLSLISFLPGLTDHEGRFDFLSPADGRLLPVPLANSFEERQEFLPRDLFGENIINSSILGKKAMGFLRDLGVLREIDPGELKSLWGDIVVRQWSEKLPEEQRMPALFGLLKGILEIKNDAWLNSHLVCLPTEGSEWVSRENAIRLPSDWNILVNEFRLAKIFVEFVGESNRILDRRLEQYCNGQDYGFWNKFKIEQKILDQIVREWWVSLPSREIPENTVDDIVHFTCWVREKQTTRRALIRRLLAHKTDNDLVLLKPQETVLTSPYAGEYRKTFFAEMPSVSEKYYETSPKDADWKSFLEAGGSRPKGKFHLVALFNKLSFSEAQSALGEPPPPNRVTPILLDYDQSSSVKLWNDEYGLITYALRKDIVEHLREANKNYLRAFAHWMEEDPGPLKEYTRDRFLYIPLYASQISTRLLSTKTLWTRQLIDHRWVIAKDGSGPYKPSELLKEKDPSRPDVQVADLSPALIRVLEEAGVLFESGVPEAPAIRRLQYEGPSAPLDKLAELLEAATVDVNGDGEKKRELIQVLDRSPLFPVPFGMQLLDGMNRVPGKRCVLRAGSRHRSDLNWVIQVAPFEEGSIENRIIKCAQEVYTFPQRTSPMQCMDFLEWVWEHRPEADSVRQLLPRAYTYIAEDIHVDPLAKEHWKLIRARAKVYTLGRAWCALDGSNCVYYDDLGLTELTEIVPRTQLATSGHLGSRLDGVSIPEGVALLDLTLLSAHYSVKQDDGGDVQVPALWLRRFSELQTFLGQIIALEDDDREKKDIATLPANLGLRRVTGSARVVVDVRNQKEVRRCATWAEISGPVVTVAGSPSDFAAALCRILLKHFGVNGGDDSTLATEVTVLIVLLDSEEFAKHLNSLKARFGIPIEEDSVQEPVPGGADGGEAGGGAEPPEIRRKEGTDPNKHAPETPKDKEGEKKEKPERGSTGEEKPQPGQKEKNKEKGKRGHTPEDRERMIKHLLRQLSELKAMAPIPDQGDNDETESVKESADERFRSAVVSYERAQGRYPICKDALQEGHDIDSFTVSPDGTPGQLVRRIEVKGRSCTWDGAETVELSRPQFDEAYKSLTNEGMSFGQGFDHWVYVVEDLGDNRFRILPTRNPAMTARKFELRGGTWRCFVEEEAEVNGGEVELQTDNTVKKRSIKDLARDLEEMAEDTEEEEDQ